MYLGRATNKELFFAASLSSLSLCWIPIRIHKRPIKNLLFFLIVFGNRSKNFNAKEFHFQPPQSTVLLFAGFVLVQGYIRSGKFLTFTVFGKRSKDFTEEDQEFHFQTLIDETFLRNLVSRRQAYMHGIFIRW